MLRDCAGVVTGGLERDMVDSALVGVATGGLVMCNLRACDRGICDL